MNTVVMSGGLTRDVELKYTGSGTAYCKLSLAVSKKVKKNDQWVDETGYFDWSLWGKRAESLAKSLTKGTQLILSGEARQNTWEKDGQKQSKIEFNVSELDFQRGGTGSGKKQATTNGQRMDDEEIPF